jgi:ribosomal protein L11 methyltransferase
VAQSWSQLTVQITSVNVDALANFLMERGAPGVIITNSGLEAFFASDNDNAALRREVSRFAGEIVRLSATRSKPRLRWKMVRPQSWENAWKRFIKPRRVGKSFWVTPPWIDAPKFRRRRVITIEPGMAFGTGAHATTRSCMEFLEWASERLPAGFSALDVGTGSGILAITLSFLGAGAVHAIDQDPIAIGVARDNLRVNSVAGRVRLSGAELRTITDNFDVVAANLTVETILEIAGDLENKPHPGGFLILSGILHDKAAPVRRRFAARFRIVKQKRSREWLTLLLRRT